MNKLVEKMMMGNGRQSVFVLKYFLFLGSFLFYYPITKKILINVFLEEFSDNISCACSINYE